MRTLLIVLFVGVAVVANAQPWSDELETKAKNGDVAAQMSVAEAYYVGDGIAQDRKKAARWYYEATLQGNAEAKAM